MKRILCSMMIILVLMTLTSCQTEDSNENMYFDEWLQQKESYQKEEQTEKNDDVTVNSNTVEEGCQHSFSDATCTEPSRCTICGMTNGSANGHNWSDSTCTEAQTCTICGMTNGSANGHNWSNSTCTEAQTCTICGISSGSANGHNWSKSSCTEASKCTICGEVSGNPAGHDWIEATCKAPQTCSICGATDGAKGDHVDNGTGNCEVCNQNIDLATFKEKFSIKLIIPSVGASDNYYCKVEFANRTGSDVNLSLLGDVQANGKICQNADAKYYLLNSGYQIAISYYRANSLKYADIYDDKYKDMYLDNSSIASMPVLYKGKVIYTKFDVNGLIDAGYDMNAIGIY